MVGDATEDATDEPSEYAEADASLAELSKPSSELSLLSSIFLLDPTFRERFTRGGKRESAGNWPNELPGREEGKAQMPRDGEDASGDSGPVVEIKGIGKPSKDWEPD